jgi:hypothetical protein
MRLWLWAAVVTVGATMAWGKPAAAADCAALANLRIETVNLLSAAEVPAAGDLPAYCRVLGYVRPAINFEMRLPLADWNGKFLEAGCGGFCGAVDSDTPRSFNAIDPALRRGYAVAAMDSGHWGASVVDGRWAYDNLVAKADWAWRSATETARVGKALIAAYYGKPQSHAYFDGCSTGGRMAGVEATRFPSDFDGIVMGAPALDYTGLVATEFAWLVQANTGLGGKPILGPDQQKIVANAVRAACADTEGLVEDPRACGFSPDTLLCKEGQSGDCLGEREVAVLRRWYRPPRDAEGLTLYPGGVPPGSEENWGLWLTGTATRPAAIPLFERDFLRYMAFEPDAGPTYDVADFDVLRDPPKLAAMAKLYNAATWVPDDPGHVDGADLSAFAKTGGKMVIWHGWGDPIVLPAFTLAWYEAAAQPAGGMDKLRETARLFLVPGMDHCGINADNASVTDTGIDPLTALEQWVEKGQAPDLLEATKRDKAGAVLWQRPVCAWPAMAHKVGAIWICAQ